MTNSCATETSLMLSEPTNKTCSACHGYPFQPGGETFAKYATANCLLAKHLTPTKISGARKCKLLAETHQSSVTGDQAVDIGRAAFKTMLNLLSNTIFSVDLADPNSDTAREFKEIAWNAMKEAGKPNLADYFPVLKKIDPQGIRRRMIVHFGKLIDLFDHMISQRLKQRKVSGSMTSNSDMLDTLLNITEENSEEMDKSKIEHLFMVAIITALFFFDLFHNQEFSILTSSCYIRTYLLRGLIQPQPHWNGLW